MFRAMIRRALEPGLLLVFCLGLGCATDPAEAPLEGGGKADDLATSVCGIEFVPFEQRGVGEIGEADTDPRSTANQTASQLNAELDCQNEIDRFFVPTYFVNEDETKILVEIANSEIVGARQLYVDFALAAEQRGSACTAPCDPEIRQVLASCVEIAQDNEPGLSRADAIATCVEDTNGTFHALCEESDNFDCGDDFETFAAQLPACQAELESTDEI